MGSIGPKDVSVEDEGLRVGRLLIRPDEVVALTYLGRQTLARGVGPGRRRRLGWGVAGLSHLFHVDLAGKEIQFRVRVVPSRDKRAAAATAALIVAWFQEHVEPRLRRELMAELDEEGELRIGRLVMTEAGFGHQLIRGVEPKLLPWSRLRKPHVSLTDIDILLNTDDPEVGEYGFAIDRTTLNSMLIPEIMLECRDRWA